MCSFVRKYFHNFFGTRCISTGRLWIKQRSSLVNPTNVKKLQFIRIKQNLFTSTDEERRHLVKMFREQTTIANIMHSTEERKLKYQKGVTSSAYPIFGPSRLTLELFVQTEWTTVLGLHTGMYTHVWTPAKRRRQSRCCFPHHAATSYFCAVQAITHAGGVYVCWQQVPAMQPWPSPYQTIDRFSKVCLYVTDRRTL